MCVCVRELPANEYALQTWSSFECPSNDSYTNYNVPTDTITTVIQS